MGFYGKIYEQMGDVFNRAKFINAEPDTFNFNSGLEDVIIDAESHGDRLPIIAGNSWIVFEQGLDEKKNPACIIYHGPAIDGKSTTQIIRVSSGADYENLIAGDLLTEDEILQLKADREKGLIYFGDTISIDGFYDKAGHIVANKSVDFKLGSIPRLADILTAEGRIGNIEEIVGTVDYPLEQKGNLSTRIATLETDFDEVHTIADEAAELATSADESATAAQESATKAENAAERAAKSASDTSQEVAEFTAETTETLSRYDGRIRGNTNAIGAGDSDTIETELDTDSLLEWAQIVIGIIGDEYNDIRNGDADTITDQIHSNDADIAQLRADLTKEIKDRADDVDTEETNRKAEITRLEGIIAGNKEAGNTALEEEAAARTAADNALQTSIDNEVKRATQAENTLTSNLSGEVARATQAENTLTTNLGSEVARATGVEQGLDTRLTAVEAKAATNSEKLVGDETVAGSVASKIKAAVDAEVNLRTAKDNELADEIGRLADLISNLSGLVEAQQTTISELQERIVVLESYHNDTTEDPTPGEEEVPTE